MHLTNYFTFLLLKNQSYLIKMSRTLHHNDVISNILILRMMFKRISIVHFIAYTADNIHDETILADLRNAIPNLNENSLLSLRPKMI